MAFKASGTLNPHGGPVLRHVIATNGIVLTEEDSVKSASGFMALGTTGDAVLGHAKSASNTNSIGFTDNGAGGNYVNTYTFAGDNQTIAKGGANVDISTMTLYSAEVDVTIGTNNSDLLGYNMDLTDEDTLDEDTAATTAAQYHNWGVDPADSTKAFVNILESSVFGL